jgi:hypothetical protein
MRTRFVSVAVVALVAMALTAVPAGAQEEPVPEPEPTLYPLVFPLVGDNHYTDTWGAARSGGRSHQGTDIIADKMIPVVAAASGTVGWMHAEQGGNCCAMALNHDDGWSSWYIHLNNDTPGTDDGLGWGFAAGIERGVHVEAGQVIGYVGDSGNAEWTVSHLHFELHDADGVPINPYPHLQAATVYYEVAPAGPEIVPCPEGTACDSVVFVDPGSRFRLHRAVSRSATVDSFFFGDPGDVALMGDWDCDGVRTPAMYRRSNGFMYLRNSNTQGVADVEFFYGDPSDVPLAGDFDGDGCDTLAIYRADEGRVYVKNSLGTGVADYSFWFGNPGDVPFVGDFDGDGVDSVGLHRASTGFVYFRNANSTGVADSEFFYGDPGDVIVAGDWDGDGDDTVAVYRPSTGNLYVKYANTPGAADYTLRVGAYLSVLVASPPHLSDDPPAGEPPAEEPPGDEEPPPEDPPPGDADPVG